MRYDNVLSLTHIIDDSNSTSQLPSTQSSSYFQIKILDLGNFHFKKIKKLLNFLYKIFAEQKMPEIRINANLLYQINSNLNVNF